MTQAQRVSIRDLSEDDIQRVMFKFLIRVIFIYCIAVHNITTE
jgi:hypothetical protein